MGAWPAGTPPRRPAGLAPSGACDCRVTHRGGGALGPSAAGTEIPHSASLGGKPGRLPRWRGGSPVSALALLFCGWGTVFLRMGSIPLDRAGAGGPCRRRSPPVGSASAGLTGGRRWRGPPPCATSSVPALHLPCGAKWKVGVPRDRGCLVEFGGWQCRSRFPDRRHLSVSHSKTNLNRIPQPCQTCLP